jgi:hypothetical protein
MKRCLFIVVQLLEYVFELVYCLVRLLADSADSADSKVEDSFAQWTSPDVWTN